MVDGGKSCFRSSEREVVSTPPLRADFHPTAELIEGTANSRRRAQVTGRFERQIFSGLSYSRKYRIALCSHIKPIAYLRASLC